MQSHTGLNSSKDVFFKKKDYICSCFLVIICCCCGGWVGMHLILFFPKFSLIDLSLLSLILTICSPTVNFWPQYTENINHSYLSVVSGHRALHRHHPAFLSHAHFPDLNMHTLLVIKVAYLWGIRLPVTSVSATEFLLLDS